MATRKRAKSLKDIQAQMQRIYRLAYSIKPKEDEAYYVKPQGEITRRNKERLSRATNKANEYALNIQTSKDYARDTKAFRKSDENSDKAGARYGYDSPEYREATDKEKKAFKDRNERKYVNYDSSKAKALSNG